MTFSDTTIWFIIVVLGLGTYAIRFSFLGLIGDQKLPDWLLRHLRYTPVALIPGLVAPLVIWPTATDGVLDFPRLSAAIVTGLVGYFTKSLFIAVIAGGATLYALLNLTV
ncbi:MAG: AzlD domain-containing protein [Pseudomonadota bacterium]